MGIVKKALDTIDSTIAKAAGNTDSPTDQYKRRVRANAYGTDSKEGIRNAGAKDYTSHIRNAGRGIGDYFDGTLLKEGSRMIKDIMSNGDKNTKKGKTNK